MSAAVGCPQGRRDPRAAWMLLDLEDGRQTATFRLLDYPVAQAQQHMLDIGLPRLFAGTLLGKLNSR